MQTPFRSTKWNQSLWNFVFYWHLWNDKCRIKPPKNWQKSQPRDEPLSLEARAPKASSESSPSAFIKHKLWHIMEIIFLGDGSKWLKMKGLQLFTNNLCEALPSGEIPKWKWQKEPQCAWPFNPSATGTIQVSKLRLNETQLIPEQCLPFRVGLVTALGLIPATDKTTSLSVSSFVQIRMFVYNFQFVGAE